jgi:predicted nucleotidyltransferase
MMIRLIETKRKEIEELCRHFRVRRLYLFGSAVRGGFDARRSDLDFLVEFESMSPGEYADCFFGLREQLESLLERPIDLITPRSLRNPYLKASIDQTREQLFAA